VVGSIGVQFDGPLLIKNVALASIQRSVERDFTFEQLIIADMKSYN
jgi:hypothetical protein